MNTLHLPINTARAFEPLLVPVRYKGAYGGRGSGKSHFFAELAIERCVSNPGTRIVCVREVQKSLRESVKLLMEDKIEALGVGSMFKVLHDRIETPGNGLLLFQGMADHTKESIKSLEGMDVAYVEEAQTMTQGSLEMLRPTIRKVYDDGTHSEIWFSWNPRSASDPVDAFLRGENPPENAAVVSVNYRDNPFFPAVLEEERKYDEVHARERYAHIWDGAYEPTAIGAIWNRKDLNAYRRSEAPVLERILVSVDHAITTEGNEHGIVVCALGEDKRGYVIEDASLSGTPRQWANRAISMFDKHDADAIVIERNQGGDLVKSNLRAVRPSIPIKEVVATKGKHVRAEPISALYETGHISHVGAFTELEDQMCQITSAGYEGEGSPDRADALVWGFTELFPKLTKRPRENREYEGTSHVGPGGWMM
jgi:phage terminase large subunit-like protein